MSELADRLRVAPGAACDLSAVDPGSTPLAPGDKSDTKPAKDELRDRLAELQARLWAEGERALLLVLQATDTGGKDGTVKKVFRRVSPLGLRIATFGPPTEQELAHDFLWRVHARTPAAGELVVFNRSHYEDVLVARVKALVPEARWRARYGHIRAWEQLLSDEGTTIVKCFLHISRDEQRRRLQKRLDRPDKHWKFDPGDLEDRERWPDYQAAYEDAIQETSTLAAPWYVVPADNKWYRNFAVASILVSTLEAMDPQFPDAPPGLQDLEVPA